MWSGVGRLATAQEHEPAAEHEEPEARYAASTVEPEPVTGSDAGSVAGGVVVDGSVTLGRTAGAVVTDGLGAGTVGFEVGTVGLGVVVEGTSDDGVVDGTSDDGVVDGTSDEGGSRRCRRGHLRSGVDDDGVDDDGVEGDDDGVRGRR